MNKMQMPDVPFSVVQKLMKDESIFDLITNTNLEIYKREGER